MDFEEIPIKDLRFDALQEIEKWALLTAGTKEEFNMMTITGFMYGKFFVKPMIQVYALPTRYTFEYLEKNDYFTVSFFKEPRHPALKTCGKLSGRDCNKAMEAGLSPIPFENTVLFDEADTVFICNKFYHSDVIKESFNDEKYFSDYYRHHDPSITQYHRIYLGQIEKVLKHT